MSDIITPLLSKGILEINGPDAAKLLQGQCTADINALTAGRWVLGGLCTVKGRLYANFILARLSDETFWLIMPAAQIEDTLTRLRKYAVFYKAELRNLSKAWHGLGTLAPDNAKGDAGELTANPREVCLQLADGNRMRWLNALQEEAYERALTTVEAQASLRPETLWDSWEIKQGWVWVTPDTCEAWLPQAIAWDALGGVSFKKGCFTGQEVVARLHYKGQSKRLLYRLEGSGPTPTNGAPVIANPDASDKSLGELIRVTQDQTPWMALAMLTTPEPDARLSIDQQPVDRIQPIN